MNQEIEDFNKSVSFAMHIVQHYNPEKYWKWRAEVINPNSRYPKALRFYWSACFLPNSGSIFTNRDTMKVTMQNTITMIKNMR